MYGQTETIVGYLFSAIGVGGLLGALLMRVCLRYMRMIPLFLLTLLIDGGLVVVFAFSTNLYVVVALWLIFGITATMNTIVTETIHPADGRAVAAGTGIRHLQHRQ